MIGASAGGVEALRAVVAGLNRRGRRIDVRVLGSPLTDHDDRPAGVILMMELDERADGLASGRTGDGAG